MYEGLHCAHPATHVHIVAMCHPLRHEPRADLIRSLSNKTMDTEHKHGSTVSAESIVGRTQRRACATSIDPREIPTRCTPSPEKRIRWTFLNTELRSV